MNRRRLNAFTVDLAFLVWCWIMLVFESKPSAGAAMVAGAGCMYWVWALHLDLEEVPCSKES